MLVDDPTLVLTGSQSANNLFFEVSAAGDTLQIGSDTVGATLIATASSNPRISLVADNLTEGTAASTITATGGSVELAPLTTTTAVSLAGSPGAHLLIDTTLLGDITTGTLLVGAFTDVPSEASSSRYLGGVDLDRRAGRPDRACNDVAAAGCRPDQRTRRHADRQHARRGWHGDQPAERQQRDQ